MRNLPNRESGKIIAQVRAIQSAAGQSNAMLMLEYLKTGRIVATIETLAAQTSASSSPGPEDAQPAAIAANE